MRPTASVLAILLATIVACSSMEPSAEPSASEPDPAIEIYDENAQPDAKSSNCGGDLGVVVGGAIQLSEEHRFLKAFISSTLGGSPYCAFTGGDWARTNATTIMLTPDPVFHFDPAPITVEGNLLTFPQTNATYTRRS